MVSSERGRRARDQTHCFEHHLLRSAVGGSSYPADIDARWRLRCQASCCCFGKRARANVLAVWEIAQLWSLNPQYR